MKKVWILGGEGMLGKILSRFCKEKEVEYLATSRQQADITDLAALKKIVEKAQPTHIVNCAAYTNVDGAEKELALAYEINGKGPLYLGRIAKEYGLKVVHLSTDYVFDGESKEAYLETDSCSPLSVYGKSKLEGEQNLQEVLPSACILRTSWLFGEGGKNFISLFLQLMKEQEEIKVVCDQKGRATYSADLAEVIFSLLDCEGIFHFANTGTVSRYDIAEKMYEILKKTKKVPLACKKLIPVGKEAFSFAAKRPSYSVLSTEKMQRVLGIQPRPWQEALEAFLCLKTS